MSVNYMGSIWRCSGRTSDEKRCRLKINKDKGNFCHLHKPVEKPNPVYLVFQVTGKNQNNSGLSLYNSCNKDFIVTVLMYLYMIFVFCKIFGKF
jgi:hypothetical protein